MWNLNFQNLTDFHLDLIKSLNGKSNGAVRLTIYDILLVFQSSIYLTSAYLKDISLENLTVLDNSRSNSMVKLDCPYMTYC